MDIKTDYTFQKITKEWEENEARWLDYTLNADYKHYLGEEQTKQQVCARVHLPYICQKTTIMNVIWIHAFFSLSHMCVCRLMYLLVPRTTPGPIHHNAHLLQKCYDRPLTSSGRPLQPLLIPLTTQIPNSQGQIWVSRVTVKMFGCGQNLRGTVALNRDYTIKKKRRNVT